MIIGLILLYLGFSFACCTDRLSTSMIYIIPILYLVDIVNDYFNWWYSPLRFPDYKNARWVFTEFILLLGGVGLFYIQNEGAYSVFTLHGVTVSCMIALGFKHFIGPIGQFYNKP